MLLCFQPAVFSSELIFEIMAKHVYSTIGESAEHIIVMYIKKKKNIPQWLISYNFNFL